jgi:hypothetical protein
MITIHHWYKAIGHISLQVNDDCYITYDSGDWGQAEKGKLAWAFRALTLYVTPDPLSSKEQEIVRHKYIPDSFTLAEGLNEPAIVAWWEEFMVSPPRYATLGWNCAKVVLCALIAGGSKQWASNNLDALTGLVYPDAVWHYAHDVDRNLRNGVGVGSPNDSEWWRG